MRYRDRGRGSKAAGSLRTVSAQRAAAGTTSISQTLGGRPVPSGSEQEFVPFSRRAGNARMDEAGSYQPGLQRTESLSLLGVDSHEDPDAGNPHLVESTDDVARSGRLARERELAGDGLGAPPRYSGGVGGCGGGGLPLRCSPVLTRRLDRATAVATRACFSRALRTCCMPLVA